VPEIPTQSPVRAAPQPRIANTVEDLDTPLALDGALAPQLDDMAREGGLRRFARLSARPALIYAASRAGVLLIAGAVASNAHEHFTRALIVWDSPWYLSIARSGYVSAIPQLNGHADQSNLGFFPLLPLLIRATHDLTGLGLSVSGLVVTFLIGLLAAVAVWWLLRDLFGETGATKGTALVFFSPGALVLSLVYTEGLTILFVSCVLIALRRRRWLLAGGCAALVTAGDPVGIAVIVPCAFASYFAIRSRREWRSLLAPLCAPAGVTAFFAYLWAHTGSPFEWFHAQRVSGWQSGSIGGSVPTAVAAVWRHGFSNPDDVVKVLSLLVAIGLLVLFLRAHPPVPWVGYVVAVLAIGILSPIVGITPRLLLRNFPLLGVVGARLHSTWFEIVLGLSTLCMAALAVLAMGGGRWTP
jgi:hypothetical protein